MDLSQSNPQLADELFALNEKVRAAYRLGKLEEARALGAEFWSKVPEPKHQWDRVSQAPMFFARNAMRQGAFDDAALWLERLRPWAHDLDVAPLVATIELIAGAVALHRGDEMAALEHFQLVDDAMGKRGFEEEDPKYWEFFASRTGCGGARGRRGRLSPEEAAVKGEELFDAGRVAEAIEVWGQGLAGLSSGEDEETEFWLRASLGDAYFATGDWSSGVEHLKQVLPIGGVENAFVWLRLGQCQFELGLLDEAANSLISGHMLDGEEIWEDEDPKYRQFLVDRGLIQ